MKNLSCLTLIATIVLALFVSCAKTSKTELTEELKSTIQNEVLDQNNKLISAANELSFDLWSKFWSTEGFISVNSGTDRFENRSEFVDSVKAWFSRRAQQKFERTGIKVTPLTEELALLTANVTLSISYKNGNQAIKKGLVTNIWKKEQSGWRIIHMHESYTTIN